MEPVSGVGVSLEPVSGVGVSLERATSFFRTTPGLVRIRVVRRLGDDPPLTEEEELLRLSGLILSGGVADARERLAWLEASDERASVVSPVARAYLHFRSGDPDAATDVLARPGAVTGDEIRAAVILRARILAAGGDPAAGLRALDRVPEAQRDAIWSGWQTWLRLRDGQGTRGLAQLAARLRSLEGRREGEPPAQAGERRYVNALVLNEAGNDGLRDLFVQQGREDRLPAFLWTDVDPEWAPRR